MFDSIERAIAELFDPQDCIVHHDVQHWHSVTFAGHYHNLTLALRGADAGLRADDLMTRIENSEPRGFAVIEARLLRSIRLPAGDMEINVEISTVEAP